MKVKIKRLRTRAVLPTKRHGSDAGWDVYTPSAFSIYTGNIFVVPLGISSEIPEGFYAQILGRSGLGTNGLGVLGGVIDAGYRGEWDAIVINHGREFLQFSAGDRIAQFVLLPVPDVEMVECDELTPSPRGECGLGSSGQ